MQSDHRQYTPLARRNAIDRLFQAREKTKGRNRKAVRRAIRKLSADQMRAICLPAVSNEERGRQANIRKRQQRHMKIVKRRAERAAFRASKPVFE
jgi:hypothetical protein